MPVALTHGMAGNQSSGLAALSRREIQHLAKNAGIDARQKSQDIVQQLAQVLSRGPGEAGSIGHVVH